ncbi:DMSO reductase [Kiloniella spongiae]|uniref:DMSO reductase n=1 Tax=Kiloniella spongiae TaxID=1489064 RepID=A0A0H2MK97_9PROT|nr:DmsC/YnfH family molybdoenzyme membrane anchor subunit [Kiloniella spongiae]KLN61177.1 DMSO reductase [Kiloniella spongiae]
MHPAKSVILFTTASGAGYGLLFLLILGHMLGVIPTDPTLALSGFGTAFILIVLGLLSSTFHLGRPERAWRALTQWRSSWLSREGILAIVTFLPTGIYGLWWAFFSSSEFVLLPLIGIAALLLCGATVYCTSMIYACLKPVAAWHNKFVPTGYLVLSLSTGALLLNAILHLQGKNDQLFDMITIAFIIIAVVHKFYYWQYINENAGQSTVGSATGLGSMGKVRLLEAAHTEANYLMKEMGFKIARKHRQKLRNITFIFGFILPIFLISLSGMISNNALSNLAIIVSILSGALGIVTERWLFFAEAKHTVSLYYGAEKV